MLFITLLATPLGLGFRRRSVDDGVTGVCWAGDAANIGPAGAVGGLEAMGTGVGIGLLVVAKVMLTEVCVCGGSLST